ncbi:hypothetical protein DJ66_0361 [Candidatus Liberibacter solanacearum]|uniref:Uncharacterized protein n=1 Tax=Candidatus Liberibacter solanacearum TaxID=556287 RepID=A0A0F4VJU6_9HYPH|nr:hypothetical protein DJ66_0361 [Candidatus Liberibacter solanacearum]
MNPHSFPSKDKQKHVRAQSLKSHAQYYKKQTTLEQKLQLLFQIKIANETNKKYLKT